jgi:hypothetical protein
VTVSDEITETWTAVPDYFCEVTTRGQARSVDRVLPGGRRVQGKLLAQRRSNRDYPIVDVYNYDGRRVTRTVHSLQMLAFAGPCPPGQETRHLNDISDDNRWPENLCYGTPEENLADRIRNNTPPRARRPLSRIVTDAALSVLRRIPRRSR